MRRLFGTALWVGVLLVGGCAKQSPYIHFGKSFVKNPVGGQVPIQHYVSITDPKTGKPVGGLDDENFKVRIGGRDIVPDVLPSSKVQHDQIGLALVVDQGGSRANWTLLKDVAETILMEAAHTKDRAAIMAANGRWIGYAFDDPNKIRGQLRTLSATGRGNDGTFAAISEIRNSGRPGLQSHSKIAIVALVCGPPGDAPLPEIEPGMPLVIVDVARTNDPRYLELASATNGLYLPVGANQAISTAKRATMHIKRQVADLYTINFKVSPREVPLRYSLTYTNGPVTATADFIDDAWAMQLAVIAGIAAAILAIVILVYVRRRRGRVRTVPVSSGGWSSGEYTIAAPNMADGDATTAGREADSQFGYGGSAGASFSGGFGDSTSAEAGPFPSPGAAGGPFAAGDVTAGALDGQEPTMGGYVSPSGDVTVGEMAAAGGGVAGFVSASTSSLVIRIEGGGASGQEIRLTSSVRVGRGDYLAQHEGTLLLPGDPKISRDHAEFRVENYGGAASWSLIHRSTTNKTYVNDSPIEGSRPLQAHDRIRMGDTVLRVIELSGNMGDSTLR